jgi:hypothetical protein
MKSPLTSKPNANKIASQEKLEQREAWYKLASRIMRWKNGFFEGGPDMPDRITFKEWNLYCQQMVKINVTYSKEKVQDTLNETKRIIKEHGGFRED